MLNVSVQNIKNMPNYLILMIGLLLWGCSKTPTSLEYKIGQQAKKCDPQTVCLININDWIDVEWDSCWAFNWYVPQDEKESIRHSCEEFTRPILFFKNGQIIYQECNQDGIERILASQVVWDDAKENSPYLAFFAQDSLFQVEQRKNSLGEVYYLLTGVNK